MVKNEMKMMVPVLEFQFSSISITYFYPLSHHTSAQILITQQFTRKYVNSQLEKKILPNILSYQMGKGRVALKLK